MSQVVQVLGSLLILVAFVASQRGRLATDAPAYHVLNLVGAAVLAVLAAREGQAGFLLLETCWALVAGHALLTGRRGGGAAEAHRDGGRRMGDRDRDG